MEPGVSGRPSAGAGPALSADDLAGATGGRLLRRSGRPVRGAAVDSRVVEPGQLFVALPGERADGHRFLADAVARGAAALVVSRPLETRALDALGDVTVVAVADGLRALGAIAATWRRRFDPLVVGVTGSIGKTSTKEAVAAVLGRRFRTLRSQGNQNNEVGLPLTVLALGPEHEAAVLEMGMYVGGEIADLAAIGRPRFGVVTAVQGVHLSRIGSLDAIERAKGELVEALPAARDGGVAILNADDARVRRMADRTAARVVLYGFAADADVGASDVETAGFAGMRFTLRLPAAGGGRRALRVATPVLGRLGVHNGLAAAAVGHAAGLPVEEITAGLAAGWSAERRVAIREAGGISLVDDSYNASPGSVRAALELLAGLPGRHVAVLGEMLELGDAAGAGHASVGRAAAGLPDEEDVPPRGSGPRAPGLAPLDLLVVVDGRPGGGAAGIADAAEAAGLGGRVMRAADRAEALDLLRRRLRSGDVVLVKASRGVELDRLADELAAELSVPRGAGRRGGRASGAGGRARPGPGFAR